MDSSGSVIVKGAIKVKQVETNITTTSATSSSGVYELQNLIPGNYLIVVEAKGFKKLERGPVQVRISDVLNLDMVLEVGNTMETVTVSGEAPLLESASASIGSVIDNRAINNLPFGGTLSDLPGTDDSRSNLHESANARMAPSGSRFCIGVGECRHVDYSKRVFSGWYPEPGHGRDHYVRTSTRDDSGGSGSNGRL